MFTLRSIKENEPCVTLMRMAYGMPGAVNDVVISAMGDDKSLTQVNPDDFLYVVARLFPEHPVGQMAAKAIETSTVLDDILLPVFNRSQLVALAQAAISAVQINFYRGDRPMAKKNKFKNVMRPPREYVSVIDFDDEKRISSFATLAELIKDVAQMIQQEEALPRPLWPVTIEKIYQLSAQYVKAIEFYFEDGETSMYVFHPDLDVIPSSRMVTLLKTELAEKQRPLEFSAILIVSTSHITAGDIKRLKTDVAVAWPIPRLLVYEYDEGFFVYCWHECLDEIYLPHAKKRGYSQAMLSLLRLASKTGCKFLCLDADGPVYDEMKTFDHDDVVADKKTALPVSSSDVQT